MIKWLNIFEHPLPVYECDIMFKFPNGDSKIGKWVPKTEVTDLGENFLGEFITRIGNIDQTFNIWRDENSIITEYLFPKIHNLNKI